MQIIHKTQNIVTITGFIEYIGTAYNYLQLGGWAGLVGTIKKDDSGRGVFEINAIKTISKSEPEEIPDTM